MANPTGRGGFRDRPQDINRGGRRPSPASRALLNAASDQDLETMWAAGLARAKAGDVRWATLIAAYLDGKPVGRDEMGYPGAFSDLADVPTEELRKLLREVR
jgi:hypothetical protein